MDREASDDEEDTRHLIHQTPKSPRSSTFQIDSPRRPPRNVLSNKRYIFAITLPLIIIFIYFTADFKSLFRTNLSSSASPTLMRDSELQALSLLQHQQSRLLQLSNRTSLQDLRSALIDQISLNKKIQQLLLLSSSNLTDPPLPAACTKIDHKLSQRRTIEWKPKQDKYLFAICTSGQMSNHLICLEKHMFFAAVLNRVLVIPSAKVDYEFNRVLDIDHINRCLGREVAVTFENFAERKKNRLHIDTVLCYFSLPQPCYVDDEHVKKLKALGVTMNELKTVWTEDVKKPTDRTVHDVTDNFSSNDDVIAIGDVFFADVEKDWVMQPGGPIAHKCQTLIEPSRVILLTAQRFIQTFLGERFVALHFRRHGFLKFCNAKNPSCFFPIPQAAECISRLVERANVPVIYLSTDAAESETGLLQSLVTLYGKTVPLVTRPARNSAEKWDALLYRKKLDGDPQVEAMLDKTICALSSVFIGAPGSTFTEDILRLRRGWGTASVCDEYLCEGEVPNFIAGDE
ncbi:putative peptide-O-fucosyltransferase [Helianthus annuus]|uniref:GDP-fucose protein O-fucosyltransferase 2 n=2 Tax=Helianthus annuus TaxID=4232 RepID=A0A251U0V4_HELAN|nr:O-fucosyltransferase 36 isoform X3 [Helianthus annuus]KAF5793487.1 putative peptide-O-fucosyltransferase [Helianthus annuus]KAJ0528322.1 putative peptide-O-fucosyltransferase [Helianthus annuus]KAJ0537252.1 putative peptide-O-fucosyltransferase [Helianthus annuus]KAJ0544751.1 putative peptide-O-fucosyltransferase [Helianthus annuus]KAJ0709751.1 putative peptide-O-fucosyltransferase [Helianthus annuus]